MSRWIHANLDFEYELRHGRTWTPPPPVQRHMAKWRYVLRAMPGWEDAAVAQGPQAGEWMVWGWTPKLRAWAGVAEPDHACVIKANSKVFSHDLAMSLGVALPDERVCTTLDEVEAAVRGGIWLVKHPLGVSGRERIEVRAALDARQRGFVERCLREGPVLVEPLVDVAREWCVQFDVTSTGVHRVGTAMLLTDAHGQHRGHILGLEEPPDDAVSTAHRAAEQVRAIGYRGPLGVDGFSGTLEGQHVDRPISELNARVTFGRIAVELARHVLEPMAWWLPSDRARPDVAPSAWGDGHFQRLPDHIDPDAASGSVVLAGEAEILRWLGARHNL